MSLHAFFPRAACCCLLLAAIPFCADAAQITVNYAKDRSLTLASGEAPHQDCSLREALNNSDNAGQLMSNGCAAGSGDDEIVFAPGMSEVKLETDIYGVLSIKSNATLKISGHSLDAKVTLNGQGRGSIFDLDNSDAHVAFQNIRFFEGFRDGAGGAINQKGGTLELANCRFEANTAVNGGAVAVSGQDSKLYVVDCAFHSNFALGFMESDLQGFGGALWFAGGLAEIRSTAFTDNLAKLRGGAVECSSSGTMKIAGVPSGNDNFAANKSLFKGNQTQVINDDINGSAGAGALGNASCDMLVSDTRFETNQTNGKGGAVYVQSGAKETYFHRVAFFGNSAQAHSPYAGAGGAAVIEGRTVMNRVSARSNSADYGGAFFLHGLAGHYARFLNTTAHGNLSLGHIGSAFYFDGPLSLGGVSIVNSTIDSNSAGTDGSSLYFAPNVVYPVRFENNILQSSGGTRNCGGSVNTSTFNSVVGTQSIQFDQSASDSCDVGNPNLAIPMRDAKFAAHGIESAIYPRLAYSPITVYSPAAQQPGASPAICESSGAAKPAGWVDLGYGTDEIGKVRDAAHCSMGAVEPPPAVVINP